MYVGSCNGFFRRLDAKTGKVQWETNVRDAAAKQYFFHGDVFIAPDRIVASADVDTKTGAEAGAHAFDRNTGRQLWKYLAGAGVRGAVVGSESRVFAYTTAGDLIALNLTSGKPEWTYPLNAGTWESPAVIDDRVVAGSNAGSVYSIAIPAASNGNRNSGHLLRHRSAPQALTSTPAPRMATSIASTLAAALCDRRLPSTRF